MNIEDAQNMTTIPLTEAIASIFIDTSPENIPGTQAELIEQLRERLIDVNQSSVSRALKKLGAFKKTNEFGRQIYALPGSETNNIYMEEVKELSRYIESVESNETMTIVKTGPGTASLVSVILDHLTCPHIIGTLAGDDTIMVIPNSIKNVQKVHNFIEGFL